MNINLLNASHLVTKEILIVEDTLESLALLNDLMVSAGYSTRQAQDGEMALFSLRNKKPDLILLDVRMPVMDGFEVCRELKKDPDTADIPVIFLSALQDKEARIQGLKLGAVDYIGKPYDPDEVLLRVNMHMELRNLQLHLGEMCDLRTRQLEKEINDHLRTENELSESKKKLQELASYLEDVREEERSRIAREIHDELGQALTVLNIDLTRLGTRLDEPKDVLKKGIDDIIEILSQASDTARRISENLRPGMLDLLGLDIAIENHIQTFSKMSGIDCDFLVDNPNNLEASKRVATAAFRIVQESLTNVARHAKANRATTTIAYLDKELVVVVQDNGQGIVENPDTNRSRGFGILGMSERAQALGGNIQVESSAGKGTRIEASLPYS